MRHRMVGAITLACFAGCASTATIGRLDGPDSEARIESSDTGAIYVRARNARIYRIGRESISAIDHPGNVEILVGAILLGITALVGVTSYQDANNREDVWPVLLVYGAPGLGLLISGLVKYVPSVRAAEVFESAPAVQQLPPGFVPGAYPPLPLPPPAPPPATGPAPAPAEPPAEAEPDGGAPTVTPGPT